MTVYFIIYHKIKECFTGHFTNYWIWKEISANRMYRRKSRMRKQIVVRLQTTFLGPTRSGRLSSHPSFPMATLCPWILNGWRGLWGLMAHGTCLSSWVKNPHPSGVGLSIMSHPDGFTDICLQGFSAGMLALLPPILSSLHYLYTGASERLWLTTVELPELVLPLGGL